MSESDAARFEMSIFRSSMKSFLKTARTTLSSSAQTKAPLTIVVGNQSADLDSILSSLVLAYTLQSSPAANPSTIQRAFIPLTNLRPADLLLRPELIPALSHANIKPSDLLTLDDLPKHISSGEQQKGVEGRTNWILVDHNKLELPFSSPEWKISTEDIIGCIDHHDEENYVRSQEGLEMRIIEKAGSCVSHIIKYAREKGNWEDNQEVSTSRQIGASNLELFEAQTAIVALAPILIDTANLRDQDKVTEIDLEAVKFLEGKIEVFTKSQNGRDKGQDIYDRDAYYAEIDIAKRDLEPLTLHQILWKDYKEWDDKNGRRLGTSAVVKSLEWMLEQVARSQHPVAESREDKLKVFWDEINQFVESKVDSKHKGLDVFSIMTGFTDSDENFHRELLVTPVSDTGIKGLSSFEKTSVEEFKLETIPGWDSEDNKSRVWSQWNLAASRKMTAPALRKALEKC